MLNLDLNSWLIQTKNPKIPADEASLYGLCQLYSCHALAYKMGSVCERTLQLISIHGDKNSYQYLATLCEIIIKLNKVTTIKCQGQVSRIHMIKGVRSLDPEVIVVMRKARTH